MTLSDELFKKIFPFDTPRKNQREIIEFVIKSFESGKKHVILNCPTGTGKSAIAYAVAAYFEKAFILTSQKILQDQYYKELNVPYILGKSNYKCQKNDELTCEFGMCGTSLKGKCSDCPYTVQKALALNNWICNLNYSYFFNIIKTKKVPARTLMVLDECHSVENELINTSTLKLNEKLLNFLGLYNISLPDNDSDNYAKINWLTEIVMPKLVNQYLYFKNQLDQFDKFNFTQEFKKSIGKFQVLERMLSIINSIKEQTKNGQRIIVNLIDKKEIEFKVLFGNKLFENNLAPMGKYFLHMSATVLSKEQYCKNLGINPNDVVYYSCDSLFPVENRIINYIPVGSLAWNHKQKTIPKLIKKVRELLAKHKGEKGIIHTVNYNIAEILVEQLDETVEGKRLLMPTAKNKKEVLEKFYKSSKDYVLISPSLTEGLDLKEDLSRFCIICKVPYMNITDTWIKERIRYDQNWYNCNVAQTLIQMTGRSIRSETDFATSYILDEAFYTFASKNYNLFPKWWQESVKEP